MLGVNGLRNGVIPALTAAFLLTSSAHAAGDPERGEALATAWCSGCHAVGTAGADAAPSLSAIANRPGRSPEYLFAWLSDPHPPMPQLDLTRQEIADLIAYLRTLRP